uniref:Integrase catalytic domain-containing protein n=1 Tax=Fagus sylvatica TaxID=28930 RepID=A0A2N9HYY2_FAGSY
MPGLDTDIVVHKIPLKPECKPVKQALRRMKPEVILKIKEEVEKQLKAGFLSTVTYSDWVANIVPVPKKDGKVRINECRVLIHGRILRVQSDQNGRRRQIQDCFRHTLGNLRVYDVMPFGLKNAGATYQRAMVTLFHDMIHHEIEVYVDDMIAKSRTAQDHLTDLRKLFQRLKKYQLRLKSEQVCLRRHIRKVIGFYSSVVSRGIEIDPAKVQAIRSMPAPKTEKEIRSFLGRINYIARFIAQLTATCEPLFKLLRKDVKIKWTEDCQKAFDKIKEYLLNPPILVPPTPGRPLILYLTVQEASMGCMLGQQDETGRKKEQAIYYLSARSSQSQSLLLELMDSEFPDEDVMAVDEDNHGRWKLYFDGAANSVGSGIGAVLVSPKGQQTPIAVKLGTNGEWQARDPKLIPYQRYISRLVPKFKYITFTYTPRAHNHFADALATLASLIKLVEGDDVRPLRIETRDIPAYCVCVEECMNVEAEIDNKPWYYDIKRFIQDREYPPRATENEKKYIRRMAFQFFLSGEILYKRTHDATPPAMCRCRGSQSIDSRDACGIDGSPCQWTLPGSEDYESWLLLVDNGERTALDMSKHATNARCIRTARMHLPNIFHTMASPWPFSAWGMDVIGANHPKGVTRFVKNNIICRYGMPEMLITDNASNLNNRMMDQLCQQFKIQHHNSAPYRPKMNGAVEAANKKLRTSVGATPYSLVYGMEAVLPVEVEIPSLRILSQTQLEEAEWAQARYEQLNFIDEKRLAALCHGQLYQRRIERAYNKKARPRTFQPGDLVLKKRNMALSDSRGKVRTII